MTWAYLNRAEEHAAANADDIACLVQIEGPMQVARRSDMDMNGHINNVTYLGWALETVPEDIYLNYSLYQARNAMLASSNCQVILPCVHYRFSA